MTAIKFLSYTSAFVLGMIFFWLFEWRIASTPTSGDAIKQPVPIDISQVTADDIWITNYYLYATSLNSIDSKREYWMLHLVKKENVDEVEFSSKTSWFTLSGFADREDKFTVAIRPSEMKGKSSNIHTLLFSYDGGFMHRNRVRFTERLRLSSASSSP